ncbi:MAG TPA: dienelactone hydrolase family protein, partial [Jatrophihabitans sp.]|nr:dienelactone hydrolase family protein [Jatrophihabitans sp.]
PLRALGGAGLAVLAAAAVACSSASAPSASPAPPAPAASSSPVLTGPAARCGPPERPDARIVTLHGPGKASLPAAVVGSSTTVAVMLHQTAGGLCGWWPYAAWVTAHYPIRAVLVDLCGWGTEARCPDPAFADDQHAQVAVAVRYARGIGAKRVVLVGASMGGALALATATETHADAVVDLSGPSKWPHADAATAAPRLRVPCLIVASKYDPNIDTAAVLAAYRLIPARPKRFVPGDGPHGWDLLPDATGWTPLARQVARWVVGDYKP